MHLEVELAPPDGHGCAAGRLPFDVGEELVDRPQLQPGNAIEVGHAPSALDHLPRRPATAVAVAKGRQRPVAPPVIVEVALDADLLGGIDHRVVRLDRREVGEDPGAVDALPPERAVGKAVLLVPGQLLGHEPSAARGGEHLGQRGRVAEHVGDPDLGAATPEVLFEEALAVHELADDGLAARQVHVRLDPHAADGEPLPRRRLLLDAGEEAGMAVAHPLVLDGLRAGEAVVGVVVHEADRGGERASALAHGLSHRPEPCGVDVGVADSHRAMRAAPRP